MPYACSLALLSAGSNKLAKMAIMAITTRSSIRVKPPLEPHLRKPTADDSPSPGGEGRPALHWLGEGGGDGGLVFLPAYSSQIRRKASSKGRLVKCCLFFMLQGARFFDLPGAYLIFETARVFMKPRNV